MTSSPPLPGSSRAIDWCYGHPVLGSREPRLRRLLELGDRTLMLSLWLRRHGRRTPEQACICFNVTVTTAVREMLLFSPCGLDN